tara:strand:- start:913 stop:1344 length:432 start_codon:yes stop_codon:yes gene_type:complete
MTGFYDNSIFNFDYQPPYLIITIKEFKNNEDEFKMTELVLKKFFKMKQNGQPIKFAYIFVFKKIGIYDLKLIKRVGKILDSCRSEAESQVYATTVVVDKNLSSLTNILQKFLNIFKNNIPTCFVSSIKQAKEFASKYKPYVKT